MKRFVYMVLTAAVLLTLPLYVSANDILGEVDYLEGGVEVHRNGKLLSANEVDIGLQIEKFDLIKTTKNGYAEVSVNSSSSNGMVVKVRPDTAFYFDMEVKGGAAQSNFKLLSGSLSLKVSKLTGSGGVNVSTESAVMGVRGTEFTVTAAPEGSILVSCTEGKVAITDESGKSSIAEPGKAVEQDRDKQLKNISVSSSGLENFQKSWVEQKIQDFLPTALPVLRGYSRTYQDLYDKFIPAYNELMKNRKVFEKYAGQSSSSMGMGQAVIDRRAVSPGVIKMRSILPLFELYYYRISGVKEIMISGNVRQSMTGFNAADFFKTFDSHQSIFSASDMSSSGLQSPALLAIQRNRQVLEWKLAQARYFLKVFAAMSVGEDDGFSSGLDSFSSDDPFSF
ncbi:MAG: hypothetical protein E4H36_00350 [Spirochaetales bacterium]|nr:MAG: hypothetical protein E4H36_00350 [Spirochaetales bacterium]